MPSLAVVLQVMLVPGRHLGIHGFTYAISVAGHAKQDY